MPKTHRYKITAALKVGFQYSDDYLVCRPAQITDKKATEWILNHTHNALAFGGHEIHPENKDIEISNIEIENLGPCSEDFYETGKC